MTDRSTPSDDTLVRRCRDGDDGAWQLLVARYSDLAYSIALRCGLDRDAAGDVVQDVFLNLYKSLRRLRRTDRLVAWVSKASRHASWRMARSLRARRSREQAVSRSEATRERLPPAELARLEQVHRVRMAYGRIGERCRRLLDALFVKAPQPSYEEIAADLGLAVGSIGPIRRRCLEKLAGALEELGYPMPERSAR